MASFTRDRAYMTSHGKTMELAYAASCWGANDPEGTANTFIKSFNGTRISRERMKIVLRDVPMFIDNTKSAQRPQGVADAIYNDSLNFA